MQEAVMKTFIASYIVSLSFLVYIWQPDVMAQPFEVIPRLAFYFGFPMGVFVSMVLIMLVHSIGLMKLGRIPDDLVNHKPSEDTELNKETKSA